MSCSKKASIRARTCNYSSRTWWLWGQYFSHYLRW